MILVIMCFNEGRIRVWEPLESNGGTSRGLVCRGLDSCQHGVKVILLGFGILGLDFDEERGRVCVSSI